MNKSAEISKDGRTLTVNTFKDLKHFLDRVRYKHFQITVDKPIKELIIKDSKTDLTVNYVTKILRNAALQTIESFEIISPDNRFCTIDGLLYSGSGENLYLCPKGKEGTLIIPDGTKMIFVEACRNCKFDKVVLPDSVEIIDKYAFSRSWNLKEVEGGKNVERIRDYAFFGYINLKHFTFHARLRGIGGDAFNNTSMSEINLPEGLRTIGPGAFNTVGTSKGFASCAGQSDMYEIHIPSTVQNIGAAAFPNASYIYIPKKVMENMSWSGIAKIGLRGGNLCICHYCNIWKLEIEGLPVIIMPKMLTEIPSAARAICRLAESNDNRMPPAMYPYSKDAIARSAAIEQRKIYPDTKTKAYITRNAALFLSDALNNESDWNQVIIGFIKDGVFTDTALRKILKKLDEEEYKDVTVYGLLNAIKKAQQNGNHKTPRLWRLANNYNETIAIKTAAEIVRFAMESKANVIVFEHLNMKKKRRGNKQKLSLWRKRDIQHRVEALAARNGIRVSYICAVNTSRLAFDGSGKVLRGKDAGFNTYELCKFTTGKVYNCDLSASKNIGARFFIRVLLKSLSAKEELLVLAKVPELNRRTSCCLATLINAYAVLCASKVKPEAPAKGDAARQSH